MNLEQFYSDLNLIKNYLRFQELNNLLSINKNQPIETIYEYDNLNKLQFHNLSPNDIRNRLDDLYMNIRLHLTNLIKSSSSISSNISYNNDLIDLFNFDNNAPQIPNIDHEDNIDFSINKSPLYRGITISTLINDVEDELSISDISDNDISDNVSSNNKSSNDVLPIINKKSDYDENYILKHAKNEIITEIIGPLNI